MFSIFVTVRLYIVTPEVCRLLTNEKQRETTFRLINWPIARCFLKPIKVGVVIDL